MKDIYEVFNDLTTQPDDLERENLSEFETEKIFHNIKKQKKSKRFPTAIAAAVAVVVLAVPVTAGVLHYVNGNTRSDFVKELGGNDDTAKENIQNDSKDGNTDGNKTEETVSGENATGQDAAKENAEEPANIIKGDGMTMEVQSISRDGSRIALTCQFTFDQDISELAAACEAYSEPEENVLDAEPFADCMVSIDGWNMNERINETGEHSHYIFMIKNMSVDKNVLVQKITIQVIGEEKGQYSDHVIDLHYQDIKVGEKVYSGNWDYSYDLKADEYTNTEIETEDMQLCGTTVDGNEYTLDRYAVTPNGVKIYGTAKTTDPNPDTISYPYEESTIRILATDDLGNKYLLYPRYPDYQDDQEINDVVYEIYDGPAIVLDEGETYHTELDPNATTLTVALQQNIGVWASETELTGERNEVCSDSFEIGLR